MPLNLDSAIDFIPRLQGDSLVFTVWKDNSPGVTGSFLPESIGNDNAITLILLGSFVLLAILVSRSLPFLLHQIKNFFYIPRTDTATESETTGEVQLLYGLVVLGVCSRHFSPTSSFASILPSVSTPNCCYFPCYWRCCWSTTS